jgi:hypothetical protein
VTRLSGGSEHWRDGGSSGDWPTKWPTRATSPRPPEPWPVEHLGRAALGFFHDGSLTEVVKFSDLATALRAGRERAESESLLAWTDETGVHIRRDPVPFPRDLTEEMLACGYMADGTRRRRRWTETRFQVRDHEIRTPTTTEETPMTEPPTDDEAAAIIAAERRAGTLLARLGLNRRAALAYREVADLRAAGATAEAIEAAEQVAQTLVDLALADIDDDVG